MSKTVENPSRDRPTDDIEVTPEMIEAGAYVLARYDESREPLEEGVRRIYTGMRRLESRRVSNPTDLINLINYDVPPRLVEILTALQTLCADKPSRLHRLQARLQAMRDYFVPRLCSWYKLGMYDMATSDRLMPDVASGDGVVHPTHEEIMRAMEDANKELADYVRGNLTVVVGHGFSLSPLSNNLRKKLERIGSP
jgi:hypothetical protein